MFVCVCVLLQELELQLVDLNKVVNETKSTVQQLQYH